MYQLNQSRLGANGLHSVVWKASKFSGCMDTGGRTQDTGLQINELVIKD